MAQNACEAQATATILVVEDDAVIAADIQQTLEGLGYHVPRTAARSDDALAAAESARPDLALMDIKLKGDVDGIDTAVQLRKRFDVPVVYLSSYSDEAMLARAKATLPYGYLIKPFSERALRTAVEMALHRHSIETQLAERDRWFFTTLQSIGDAVIATDPGARVTFMNRVAESLTTWTVAEARGRPLFEVFPAVAEKGGAVTEAAAPHAAQPFETRAGTTVRAEYNAAPIVDDRGKRLGEVIVFRDVRAREEMERSLRNAERLASLGTMAANLAHEVNTPLTAVTVNLGVARELADEIGRDTPACAKVPAFKELVESLADAHGGADRVLKIASEIRQLARSTRASSERQTLSLPDVLDIALKTAFHAIPPKTRIARNYDACPLVNASDAQLSQLFLNLLTNATDAVAQAPERQRAITLSTFRDERGHAVVEIHDTGPGIPPSVLDRIFEPFFTTKAPGRGTGLGLAISQALVESLGGDIGARNDPDGGAVLRVRLPPA